MCNSLLCLYLELVGEIQCANVSVKIVYSNETHLKQIKIGSKTIGILFNFSISCIIDRVQCLSDSWSESPWISMNQPGSHFWRERGGCRDFSLGSVRPKRAELSSNFSTREPKNLKIIQTYYCLNKRPNYKTFKIIFNICRFWTSSIPIYTQIIYIIFGHISSTSIIFWILIFCDKCLCPRNIYRSETFYMVCLTNQGHIF